MASRYVTSVARRMTLSAALLATSLYCTIHAERWHARAAGELRAAEQRHAAALGLDDAIGHLAAGRQAVPVRDAAVATMAALRALRTPLAMEFELTLVSHRQGGATTGGDSGQSLASYVERLPDIPALARVSLRLRGTYRDYARLRSFFAALSSWPVVLRSLRVERNELELGIDVYGT